MIDFLEVQDVLQVHADQIERYGGSTGLRDVGLLRSAVEQPRATFGGEFLHEDIYMMAAAYLYHLVMNHAFVDGNKRVGAASALVFLDINGIEVDAPAGALYDLTISVAKGEAGKEIAAQFFRTHTQNKSDEL